MKSNPQFESIMISIATPKTAKLISGCSWCLWRWWKEWREKGVYFSYSLSTKLPSEQLISKAIFLLSLTCTTVVVLLIHSPLGFCFPQLLLPMANCGPKILNEKFQKSTAHKFKIVRRSEQHDKILPCPAVPVGMWITLCPVHARCTHSPPVSHSAAVLVMREERERETKTTFTLLL